jgi:hypothetical protein
MVLNNNRLSKLKPRCSRVLWGSGAERNARGTLSPISPLIRMGISGKVFEINYDRLIGSFTQIYDENFAEEEGIPTHYVALAFQIEIQQQTISPPPVQHKKYCWVHEADVADGKAPNIHKNTLTYFKYIHMSRRNI